MSTNEQDSWGQKPASEGPDAPTPPPSGADASRPEASPYAPPDEAVVFNTPEESATSAAWSTPEPPSFTVESTPGAYSPPNLDLSAPTSAAEPLSDPYGQIATPPPAPAPTYGSDPYTAPTYGGEASTTPSYGSEASTTPSYSSDPYTPPSYGSETLSTPSYGSEASSTPSYGTDAGYSTSPSAYSSESASGTSASPAYGQATPPPAPSAGDPYSTQPSYGAPTGDPYATPQAASDPYAAQASYGAPTADPYAQAQPGYGQPDVSGNQGYAQSSYGDPAAAYAQAPQGQQYPPQQYPPVAAYQQPGYPMGAGEPPVPHGTAVPRNSDDLTWGSAAHWSPILIGILGPILTLTMKGNDSQFVKQNSQESLNFELTLLIGYVISIFLMFVLVGFITWTVLWVLGLVFHIMGAMEASKGKVYKYPFSIKFLK